VNGKENLHKTSAKVSIGLMQGNSIELSYRLKSRKKIWLDEYILLPKSVEATTILGRFPKIEAMAHQEITTLASHPRLSFGFEHDIGLGCWNWVWELTTRNSSFRVPIPILHLGTVTSPLAFYQKNFYYGMYCLMVQSLLADILQDEKMDRIESTSSSSSPEEDVVVRNSLDSSKAKTKQHATQQRLLMENVAERRRWTEMKQDGLVILSALYFLEVRNGVELQVASMDATIQLQFWVSRGRLTLPAISKSTLLGFYDLRTEIKDISRTSKWDWRIWKRFLSNRHSSTVPGESRAEPMIRVRYSFQGFVYEISVSDRDELSLPTKRARLLGRADVLQ